MTTWHHLPFELKAQILAYCIEAAFANARPAADHPAPHVCDEVLFDLLNSLEVAPELRVEASVVAKPMIEQCHRQYASLERVQIWSTSHCQQKFGNARRVQKDRNRDTLRGIWFWLRELDLFRLQSLLERIVGFVMHLLLSWTRR